jgi:hypothetical protein
MLKKDEGKDVVLQENSGEAQKPGDNYRSLDEKVDWIDAYTLSNVECA